MPTKCDKCVNESVIKGIQDDLKELKDNNRETHKTFFDDISKLKEQSSIDDERYKTIMDMLKELKADLKILKEDKSKKWDLLTGFLLTSIVGAVIGFLFSSVVR